MIRGIGEDTPRAEHAHAGQAREASRAPRVAPVSPRLALAPSFLLS
jgi:hypothetical protein